MTLGHPFDRLDFFKNISYYTENGWGSYRDLIELTMKDFIEIAVGLESKANEEELTRSLHQQG